MKKLYRKLLLLAAAWGLCAAAVGAPVIVDTFPPAKGAKSPQYTVGADKRHLDGRQLGIALSAIAKDEARGAATPVAVLLDPALTLEDLSALVRVVRHSGMKHVRYFMYRGGRSMVAELVPTAPEDFPLSRLESEMMAAPK